MVLCRFLLNNFVSRQKIIIGPLKWKPLTSASNQQMDVSGIQKQLASMALDHCHLRFKMSVISMKFGWSCVSTSACEE